MVDSPADMPDPSRIVAVGEPWMNVSIVAPDRYIGTIMELVTGKRGDFVKMDYLRARRGHRAGRQARDAGVQGAAVRDAGGLLRSTEIAHPGLREHGLLVLALLPGASGEGRHLVNGIAVDALSVLIHRDRAQQQGRALVERLRSLIPRQMFEVPIETAIGGRIVARESVKALRKNVSRSATAAT